MEVIVWGSVGLVRASGFARNLVGSHWKVLGGGMTKADLGLRSSLRLLHGEQTPGAQ